MLHYSLSDGSLCQLCRQLTSRDNTQALPIKMQCILVSSPLDPSPASTCSCKYKEQPLLQRLYWFVHYWKGHSKPYHWLKLPFGPCLPIPSIMDNDEHQQKLLFNHTFSLPFVCPVKSSGAISCIRHTALLWYHHLRLHHCLLGDCLCKYIDCVNQALLKVQMRRIHTNRMMGCHILQARENKSGGWQVGCRKAW